MSEHEQDGNEQFVVYLNGDAQWVGTHGGPYAPMKASEVRESMKRHIARGNYRDWSIPEDAEKVETVTKEELRELKEVALSTDGGTVEGGSEQYKCRNCDHEQRLNHEGHGGPICPNCKVESMTEMVSVECRTCGCETFKMRQRAPRTSITGAEPTVECVECGWTARVDDSGVWS